MANVFAADAYLPVVQCICADRYGYVVLSCFIQSGSPVEQEAAIAMIGFWPQYGQEDLLKQSWLLGLVAEKIWQGQVGWAAISTLTSMGTWKNGAQKLKEVKSLLPNLQKLLGENASGGAQQLAIVRLYAKWLAPSIKESLLADSTLTTVQLLTANLEKVLYQSGNMRIKIWAAQALVLLDTREPRTASHEWAPLIDITPDKVGQDNKFTYIWQEEKRLVDKLFADAGLDKIVWEELEQKGLQIK